MEWNQKRALLKLMIENDFNALISFDQNIEHQQNFEKYPVTVFVLIAEVNTYKVLQPLCTKVNYLLKTEKLNKGVTAIQ